MLVVTPAPEVCDVLPLLCVCCVLTQVRFCCCAAVPPHLCGSPCCNSPQVIALSDLVIEVWGLPYGRMFAQGSHKADARTGGSTKHDSGKAGSRDGAGGADGSSAHGELPAGSTFLGAVTVSNLNQPQLQEQLQLPMLLPWRAPLGQPHATMLAEAVICVRQGMMLQ